MSKRISVGMIVAAAAILGLVFWAGRVSAPSRSSANDEPAPRRTRSLERSAPRESARKSGPGAGDQAITSAMQLRDFYKNSGGNHELATAQADLALSKMNAAELSKLVQDLAVAQADNPGYGFTLEIGTACARWAEVDPDAALNFVLSSKQASFRTAAMSRLFAGMAKNDPAFARSKLADIDDPALRRSAQASLLSALAVASPDDWVAVIKSDPSLGSQFSLGSIASEWAIDDPARAAERLAKLPASMQANGVASIAKVWAGKDGPAAMAWAQSLTDPKQKKLALAAVAGGLAAKDPDAAMASLASLDPAARRAGLVSMFSTLVDLDFDSALERASALSDPDERRVAMMAISGGRNYSDVDPFSSVSYTTRSAEQLNKILAKLPSGPARTTALSQLGSQLGSCTREEAESILATYPPKERQGLQASMLQQLSYNDPARALELYQSLPPGQVEPYTEQQIVSNLAQRDPEAALKAALASSSDEMKTNGVSYAFAALAKSDPEAACRRLASLPAGSAEYGAALSSVASAWASQDPDAAQAWVAGLKGDDQSKAFNVLVPAMAQTDPKQAAELLSTLLKSSSGDASGSLSNTTSNLVTQWARADPEAAASWTAGLQEGDVKTNAVASLASNWCRQDADGAATWIDTLPAGQSRDSAIPYMVEATSRKDPATAFEWAASVDNEQQRANLISSVVQRWKTSDPDKARAAVNQANVSPEVRASLLRQIK